jgi:hypothetical protein
MVRHRFHLVVALGRFNEALQWARDMDAVARKNGWSGFRVMVPSTGKVNAFILESDYADVVTFHQENEAFLSDADAMKVFRRGTDLNAPGTHPWDELEEEAPTQIA